MNYLYKRIKALVEGIEDDLAKASDPNASIYDLKTLGDHSDLKVTHALLNHPKLKFSNHLIFGQLLPKLDNKTSLDHVANYEKAENPTTTSEELEELSKTYADSVIINPNAKPETLLKILNENPKLENHFWENPMADLTLLENPDFLNHFASKTENPKTIDKLIDFGDEVTHTKLLRNYFITPTQKNKIFKVANDKNVLFTGAMEATDSDTLHSIMEKSHNGNYSDRTTKTLANELFHNNHIAPKTLDYYLMQNLKNLDEYDLQKIISHRKMTPELINKYADLDDPVLPEVISSYRGTPAETLDKLANHKRYQVRKNVAGNNYTHENTLKRLAKDMMPDISNLAIKQLKNNNK